MHLQFVNIYSRQDKIGIKVVFGRLFGLSLTYIVSLLSTIFNGLIVIFWMLLFDSNGSKCKLRGILGDLKKLVKNTVV